ncbi:hypothetical protein LINPERPRIM_LOCUS29687 [Linum perenne]
MVLVDSILEAKSVEEAVAKLSVVEGSSLPVDRHPEKRLKASFKVWDRSKVAHIFEGLQTQISSVKNNGTGIVLLSDIFGFEDSTTMVFSYRVACNGIQDDEIRSLALVFEVVP